MLGGYSAEAVTVTEKGNELIPYEEFSIWPKTIYKNNEFDFTIEYPSALSVDESYSDNIVEFYDDVVVLSIKKETSDETSLDKMVNDNEKWCAEKSFRKDSFECKYEFVKKYTKQIDGKTTYAVLDRNYLTESKDSPYEDSRTICLQYHIIADYIWELNGCLNVLESHISNEPLMTEWIYSIGLDIVEESMDSFKIIEENNESNNLDNEQESKIPGWVKGIFGWYSLGQVSDDELIAALQFLIQEGIIEV